MGFVSDIVGGLTGSTAAQAATQGAEQQAAATQQAIAAQQQAAVRGQEFLAPFAGVGQEALGQAGFLTDPQAQFEFLQQNPLFQLSLDEAQRQTQQSAASRGRLTAGDTLQQLSQNVLLSAQPLIGQQQQNIAGLLDFGRGVATTQAGIEQGFAQQVSPLLQDIGNVQAAGGVGAATARGAGAQNLLAAGLTDFSDFGNTGFGRLAGLLF